MEAHHGLSLQAKYGPLADAGDHAASHIKSNYNQAN